MLGLQNVTERCDAKCNTITPNRFGKQYNLPLGNPMWTKSSVNWPLATTVIKSMQPRKEIKISRTSVVHFSPSNSKKNVMPMHNWVRGLTVYVAFYCLKVAALGASVYCWTKLLLSTDLFKQKKENSFLFWEV